MIFVSVMKPTVCLHMFECRRKFVARRSQKSDMHTLKFLLPSIDCRHQETGKTNIFLYNSVCFNVAQPYFHKNEREQVCLPIQLLTGISNVCKQRKQPTF